jgi:hypothetical protein
LNSTTRKIPVNIKTIAKASVPYLMIAAISMLCF